MTFRFGDSIEPASMAGGAVLEDLWRAVSLMLSRNSCGEQVDTELAGGLTKGKGDVELNWTRFR